MKESQIKKGMYVLISSTNETKATHTTVKIMEDMVGKIYKIERVRSTRYGLTAIINSYYWHVKDLSIPKKPKIHYFDIKELVI